MIQLLQDFDAWFQRSAPALLTMLVVAIVLLPRIGRIVARAERGLSRKPRLGEALIRLGADLQGLREVLTLPRGTSSISAAPQKELHEAVEALRDVRDVVEVAREVRGGVPEKESESP